MTIFGHPLYFSEDLLLLPPHTNLLIDFKQISSTTLEKVGGGGNCSHTRLPVATPLDTASNRFEIQHVSIWKASILLENSIWTGNRQDVDNVPSH